MKTFVFTAAAALFSGVTFAALNGNPGADAQSTPCGDAPGMEGCSDEEAAVPWTMVLTESLAYDEATIVDVTEDSVLVSDDTIETINAHFTVRNGVTLTFRAPAVKIARHDEASSLPLFKVSGTVIFEATGSVPALLDGSLVDGGGIVQVDDEDAVFLPGTDNIVRYHTSGITISRMEDTKDMDGSHHEEVELSPQLKASLAASHTKFNARSEVPPSTFSPSSYTTSTSSSSSSSSYSSPPSTSSSTSEVVDNDVDSGVCPLMSFFDTPDGPGSCPSPAFSLADTATSITPAGDDQEDGTDTTTTASADCNGDTRASTRTSPGDDQEDGIDPTSTTAASAECKGDTTTDTTTSTSTPSGGNSNNGSEVIEHEHNHNHEHDDDHEDEDEGSNNNCNAESDDQTESSTAPPNSTADNVDPSVSSPKRFIIVGDKLTDEPLVSSTGKSALWIAEHGSIIFAKATPEPSDASSRESTEGIRASVLIYADNRQLERVLRARTVVVEEMREGSVSAHKSRKTRRSAWGWVPFRSRLETDVERAREHLGEVEATISNRGCLEVSVDGTCVLSKSGPFKREWMNRFPWRRRKNNGYEMHVKDDGMEVRLGEKRVWGVSADEMMD